MSEHCQIIFLHLSIDGMIRFFFLVLVATFSKYFPKPLSPVDYAFFLPWIQ